MLFSISDFISNPLCPVKRCGPYSCSRQTKLLFFEKLKRVPVQRLPLLIHTFYLKNFLALQIVFLLFEELLKQWIRILYH